MRIGLKTSMLMSVILISSAASAQDLKTDSIFVSNGTDTIRLGAPAGLTGYYSLVFPVDDGSPGEFLASDGSGNLGWVAPSGNVITSEGEIIVGDASGDPVAVDTNSVGDIDADATNGLTIKSGAIDATTLFASSAELSQSDRGVVKSAGQLLGTNTSDNAAAGFVGEYVENAPGTVGLASGVPEDVATINLTAGDWDVTCSVFFNFGATTTSTYVATSISKVSNTLASTAIPSNGEIVTSMPYPSAANLDRSWSTPSIRVSLSAADDLYCVAQSTFAVSSTNASGALWARRVR